MKQILRASLLLGIMILKAPEVHAAIVDGSRIMDQGMNENLCALTFDDGPSPYTTPQLLDTLAAYKIPVTFFMLGKNANAYPAIVDRIVAEGHEIGNHSWSHPNLRTLSSERQLEQIVETDRILRSHGAVPLFMRPPYGSFDERTVKIAEDLGISLILWSMDSKDWKRLPANYAKVPSTRGTIYEDGELRGIFLFHDIHKTTVDDVPRIIEELRAGGCQKFVTVSEYLAGFSDPEPSLLMTRRTDKAIAGMKNAKSLFPAGSGPIPFARCSSPRKTHMDKEAINLHDAHASAPRQAAYGAN